MNKMTDEQIKKGLECCSKSGWLNDCDGCPCYDEKEDIQTSECQERIIKNAIDLINRQQKTIERLNICVKSEDEVRAIANATIQSGIKIIKAEAIKEFVGKYEKVLLSMLTTATLEKKEVICSCLDTLEEMVGKE